MSNELTMSNQKIFRYIMDCDEKNNETLIDS